MVVRWNAAAPAPIANGLETVGDVTRPPVLNAPIRQGDEPDVFAVTARYRQAVQITAGPDLPTKTFDASLTDKWRIEADLETTGVTCFRWDKPGGYRRLCRAGKGRVWVPAHS